MNRLRDGGEVQEIWQAGQKAALALGYEVPDEVAKTIIVRLQGPDAGHSGLVIMPPLRRPCGAIVRAFVF